MSGRSQAVRIPASYRFTVDEVYIRKDPQTGDIILSQVPGNWTEIFAVLDNAGLPEDFMRVRNQGLPPERDGL